jgi:hypothetical protein
MYMHKAHENKDNVITARCDRRVKELLMLVSRSEGLSMSDVIAKSVVEYHQNHFPGQALFVREQGMFGKYGSGKGDLSVGRKKYLKEKLDAKHRRR